jgi:GTP pyrophosphokinase
MKVPAAVPGTAEEPAVVVQLAGESSATDAAAGAPAADEGVLQRARAFAMPLLGGRALDTGEDALAHADGVAAILASIGAAPGVQAAAYLVYAADHLQKAEEVLAKAFGDSYARLATSTRQLVMAEREARRAGAAARAGEQAERLRRMLLAFSRDLRVVLMRLASRLQTLRWHGASRRACPPEIAAGTRSVFVPLAGRLGLRTLKWELEDWAFRFLEPDAYREVAQRLEGTRAAREAAVEASRAQLAALLARHGVAAEVQGRPKHLASIAKKMRDKALPFERVLDVRALRVVTQDVAACYAALARVHERWPAVAGEFDDYIARPKANGYQSLHTVVTGDDGRPMEVQVRTRAMHEHAEHGVAAHWLYKEGAKEGARGAGADDAARIAEARKAVLRQLLEWERESAAAQGGEGAFGDRIYVFTPQAQVVDLPAGGTPLDFAYALHTDLGHRCRGAKVDGRVVPLSAPLANGQTVEITAAKEGGPSLDWLNEQAHFLASPRAKAKVRAWFNAQAAEQTIARGRGQVERLLQREGRTAVKLDALAQQLGFRGADALFEVVGKDEYSLRHVEQVLRPAAAEAPVEEGIALRKPQGEGRGGVLVVGVESLLTTLAKCCRPAAGDAIGGFVTRGRGVAIHRRTCSNFRHLAHSDPGRVIEVEWGRPPADRPAMYPVDVQVEATDRAGLLRDISEVFSKERANVIGVNSQTVRDGRGATAWMTFTVEVPSSARLAALLAQVARVAGVRHARRR